MLADDKLTSYIYLKETGSTNTSNNGGHLQCSHQTLRDQSSLKGDNVTTWHSGSNTEITFAKYLELSMLQVRGF